MNVLSGILAVAVFGFGATSVYLYSELDAARNAAGARTAPCRDEQAQIAVLQGACVELDTTQDEGFPADDPGDASVEPAVGRRAARVSPPDVRAFQAAPVRSDISTTRREAILRRMYRGVAEELNLSPDQEAELLALLLQQQTEQMETARRFAGDRAAMTSAMNDLRNENSTELMVALGDTYLEFEDYQESLGERMQIEQAALQLEAADVPLEEAQRTRLLAAMVEERDRLARPTWAAEIAPQENIARQQAWQETYEERVRDRATSILSSDQLKQYDVYSKLQSAARRRQIDAWREASRRPLNAPSSSPGPT